MDWNNWIRQTHRWVAVAFTATVVANFVAFAVGEPPMWLVYLPLAPLFLLLPTGLYMFVLPTPPGGATDLPAMDRSKRGAKASAKPRAGPASAKPRLLCGGDPQIAKG